MTAFINRPRFLALALLVLMAAPLTARGEVIRIEENAGQAGLELRAQEASGVEIHYAMQEFALDAVDVDGQSLQKISLPGCFLPNNAGAPDLPGFGRFIALPFGATAKVTILNAETRTLAGLDLVPAPPIQFENDDTPPTFERDMAIYGRSAGYPESPVRISEPFEMRGANAVTLGVMPFQYNPVTRDLTVYTSLDIRVDFVGGTGRFSDDRLRNRYWESLLQDQLLNYETLPAIDFNSRTPRDGRSGYEYVIITADNATCLAWADSIKTWRKAQGITTEVYTTSQIGTTSTQIENWLNNAYNTWDVPPVAFLILGDYPSSGDGGSGVEFGAPGGGDGGRETLPGVTAPMYTGYCVSDNIYADTNGNNLPEMAHGRICAKTDVDLATMVGKMFSYERQPVMDPSFYDHPVISGGWQTERWFILCAEVIFGHQQNVLGKNPVREYAIYSGYPGGVWSTASNTAAVVNYFGPSGLGYIPQTPSYLTDWGGNYLRINTDINAGAYLVIHRDHGLETGWGEPAYNNSHVNMLRNTAYPFVFSVNCLTGKYNWQGCSFSEFFHRVQYGAVGLLAASEVSYSFVNDAYIWGVFDSMWPGFDPGYGSGGTPATALRPGFGQTYGKYYLQASSWPSNPNNKAVTYHLFHHHGDVFITMNDQVPTAMNVVHEDHLEPGEATFTVQAEAGALIGLSVDGEIIGVADATGSAQPIPIIPQSEGSDLRIVVTKADRLRYDVTIPIEAGSIVVDPQGGGDFLTIQAAIDAAVDNDLIELVSAVYTGPGNRDLNYHGKAITIQSMSGDPASCVIDCEYVQRGFNFVSEEGPNSVLQNVTIKHGLATDARGAGVYCLGSAPSLTNVYFIDNEVAGAGVGAGLAAVDGSAPELHYCVFSGSQTEHRGADVHLFDSTVLLDHCTLFGGSAPEGGVINVDDGGQLTLRNTIIAFSQAGPAVECLWSGTVTLDCCDLYGNAGGDWVGCIADQYGVTNISLDPQFCNPAAGDFHLWNYTPCVSEMCGQVGALGIGCFEPSDVRPGGAAPTLLLGAARPNPFTQTTSIAYSVPATGERALLQVYDPSGRLVRTLVDGREAPGAHVAAWDGADERGERLPSGIYYYQLSTGAEQATRRMILLR
jgi:hypothetical protein